MTSAHMYSELTCSLVALQHFFVDIGQPRWPVRGAFYDVQRDWAFLCESGQRAADALLPSFHS